MVRYSLGLVNDAISVFLDLVPRVEYGSVLSNQTWASLSHKYGADVENNVVFGLHTRDNSFFFVGGAFRGENVIFP
jgi:hypothetical protein